MFLVFLLSSLLLFGGVSFQTGALTFDHGPQFDVQKLSDGVDRHGKVEVPYVDENPREGD